MAKLQQLRAFLDGKKSYLGMIALGTLGLFWSLGWVSDKTAQSLGLILGAITGISFRSAIQKSGPIVVPDPDKKP